MDLKDKIAEKEHDELLRALSKIASSVKKDDDSKVVAAVEKMTAKIEGFTTAVNQLAKAEKTDKPEAKEQKNEDKTVTLMAGIAQSILDGLGDLKKEVKELSKPQPKTEWVHTITKRNYSGWADEIVSKPKNKA